VAARWINDKPRKKPYLIGGLTGRVAFWIIALVLWLGLAQRTAAMLTVFFLCVAFFNLTDGLASVAWFDLLARAIPVKRRGRLMGLSQIISGVAGLGVGLVISSILTSPRFTFPDDYTLIFLLAGVAFVPSTIALLLLREVRPNASGSDAVEKRMGSWFAPWRLDSGFRQLMVCRVLTGMVSVVSPFYVIHATDILDLSEAAVGSFVAAQQVAGLASGALLGWISDRWGPAQTVRISSLLSLAGPLFALVTHVTGGNWLIRLYPFVYVALGAYQSSIMLGFYNYLLEIAPDDVRPSYIGLGNTITGVLTLAPTLGGWMLQATSYSTLFAVTAVVISAGFLMALRLGPAAEAQSHP
jgi:MFS family permease